VKIDLADIERRFRELTDEQLLAIRPEDLNPEARIRYVAEATGRGLLCLPPEPDPAVPPLLATIVSEAEVSRSIAAALDRRRRWSGGRALAFNLSGLADYLAVRENSISIWIAIVVWWASVIGAEIFFPRLFRGRAPILWLRRFRSYSGNAKPFEFFLFQACDCLGTPFTLQDQSYSYSPETGMGTVALLIPGFILVPLLLFEIFPDWLNGGNVSLAIAVLFLALIGLYVGVPRWFGVKRVIDTGGGEQVAACVRKIQRGRVSGFTSAVVLRCSQASWQTVVTRAHQLSALTVIDVTDLSENVLWELQTAVRLKDPRLVVLACRIEPGAKWEVPVSFTARICRSIDASLLEAMPVYLYPSSETQLPELPEPPIELLRRIIARALQQSSAPALESPPL
jgi:hypothetical protein